MAYTTINFKTKKSLKEAVANGRKVMVYGPGIGLEKIPQNGVAYVEGPHFPEPHKWYAKVVLKDGLVVKVQ